MKRPTTFRKKLRMALIGLAASMLVVPVAFALLGDVNDDGFINEADVQLVLESVIGLTVLTAQQQSDADTNGDGVVDSADALQIQQRFDGLITEFPARLPQHSGPIAMTRDGLMLGVVNPDSGSATFLETTGDTVLAEVSVGLQPQGIAFSRSGRKAYVANGQSGTLSVIDTTTFAVMNEITVGVEPFGVVVNFRGDRAYVSNMASSTISEVDLSTEMVINTLGVGLLPQGMAITSDSSTLYVTHLETPEVSVLATSPLSLTTTIPIAEGPFDDLNPSLPAGKPNRLKGIAIHPTLDEAWLPHILSNSGNFVETLFNTTIFPAISVLDTSTDTEITGDRMTLFSGVSTVISNPETLAFTPDGLKALVVSAASDDLTIFNVATRQETALLRDVGDNPRGVVVCPDGSTAYVFNRLTPEVSVVDLATEMVIRVVSVSTDPLAPNIANGRRLFFTSAPTEVSQDRFFGCEACHFDGRGDGQTWFFTNGPRQTLSMAANTTDNTGLLHHNADRQTVQDFRFTFTRLQNGTGLSEDQLDDLADFINTGIRPLENPFLNADDSRTAASRRGRRLFSDAGCTACHLGAFLTDATGQNDPASPLLHDVGIFAEGTGTQDATDKTRDQDGIAAGTVRPAGSFESTSLVGVWEHGPFLHEGRSATLLDVLTTDNATDQHGVTSGLSAGELDDLVAYMQQLSIVTARVGITFPVDGARLVDLTTVSGRNLDDVVSVDVFVDGAGPIAAVVTDETFSAAIPPGMVPVLADGETFDITARALTVDGLPGRDDIEVEVNFGGAADASMSTVDAAPGLITADGISKSQITVTPLDSLGARVGSGLTVEAQANEGSLGPVTDLGDGTYGTQLTSSMAAVISTITANVLGEGTFTDTAEVRFAAGTVDAVTSSVSSNPTQLEADGVSTSVVTVTPRDAFGNTLDAGQAVVLSVDLGTVGAAVDQGDGTYTGSYKAGTTEGPATLSATVNGTPLNSTAVVTLVADVTAPDAADLSRITFGTPDGGVSQITGGAGAVEPLSTVNLENTDTLATTSATAATDGSFTASLTVTSNETVCIEVVDLALNASPLACKIPFVVDVSAIRGFVQTPAGGGGFDPVAGARVQLADVNTTNPNSPGFTPLFPILVDTTDVDGSYEIVLPMVFVPDPDLGIVHGPDADSDGFFDSITNYSLVNDVARSVLVDGISTTILALIAFNDQLLCEDPPDCNVPGLAPVSNFTPDERTAIDETIRAATTEIDFSGMSTQDIVNAIAADIFFDTNRDGLDQIAFETFRTAAETPGAGDPPVLLSGSVMLPPGVPLVGETVQLATFTINPLLVAPIVGATGVTDGSGNYTVALPGFVVPGSSLVAIVIGDVLYDGGGNPGAFNSGIGAFSIGTFVTSDTGAADVDVAGRVAMSLIAVPMVPIENFSTQELDELTALVRTRLPLAGVPLANRTLQQIFGDSFSAMLADVVVTDLVTDISDPETGDNSNVTADPTMLEADGVSHSTITVEPLTALSERVGPGLLVELSTDFGTISETAIDNHDGTYTGFLHAPTLAGTSTVTARVNGVALSQQPVVTFTADLTAPAAPDASRIVVTVGVSTLTVIGLPGSVEPGSEVEVENTTQATTVVVTASEDGSFRVDMMGGSGDSLLIRATDAAANTSTDTALVAGPGLVLPAIGNPSAIPGGVTPVITPKALGDFGAAVPAGLTFLRGFELDLEGETASTPLDVLIESGVAVPAGETLVLGQEILVEQAPQWRVLSPATAAGGVLFPVGGPDYPGLTAGGSYAYLSSADPLAFVHGTVTGDLGAIGGVLQTLDGSPFVDLTRADGGYLLVGAVSPDLADVGSQLFVHEAAEMVEARLPFAGAEIQCDFALSTRADTAYGFTGRFTALGQTTRRLALLPSGDQIYTMLNDAGDIAIVDSQTLAQVSLADDAQQISDLAFTPNGFEAFIGYFSRVRDFTVPIQEPGLLISNVGFPQDVAMTPDGNLALIASSLDNSTADSDPDAVFVIDTFTNEVEETPIAVDADPEAIAVNKAGDRAYTVSRTQGTITVIDLPGRVVIDTIAISSSPTDVVTNATELFVADIVDNTVLVLDMALLEDLTPGNEILATIPVGAAPGALALAPGGGELLVAEQQDDTVSVIDVGTRTVSSVCAVTDLPLDIGIHPDGTRAYALDPLTRKGLLEFPLADADTVPPVLIDVGPADRIGSLLQDSPVEVVFSEKMDTATLIAANVAVLDAGDVPIPGMLVPGDDKVSVVFTPDPGTRYALNSTVKVQVGTGATDASGLALPAPLERTVPTVAMQLPDLLKISVDLTGMGVEVTGSAVAVEPESLVEVANLTAAMTFTTTAGVDGSFSMIVEGLDTDDYELVTSIFGGRAKTDALPLPVSFTIILPDASKVSYQPGAMGTLAAAGAAGAVDPQSSEVLIRNLTSGQSFSTTTIGGDGSFSLGIFADQGDSLELVSTILDVIELDPVPLASPNLAPPLIDFLSPDRFVFGDPQTLIVAGQEFGSVPANILLVVGATTRTDFSLEPVDGNPGQQALVLPLVAGTDSSMVTVTVGGQTSNAASFFAELAPNTSPFAEEVIASSVVGDPAESLGASNNSSVDLGPAGSLTVRMGSTVMDGSGNDFQVFEDTSDGSDCYEVLVSASSVGPFDSLGEFCGTAFVNLSGHDPIRFVQLVDADDGGNAAKIDAVFAIRVQLSLAIEEMDDNGNAVARFAPRPETGQRTRLSGTGRNEIADFAELPLAPGSNPTPLVSATIPQGDTWVCPPDTKSFSVQATPPPAGGGGYGGGCTDTVTWSVSGGGTVMPTMGNSTTYTPPMMGGFKATITATVVRTGNCSNTGTATATVTVDVVKVVSVMWVAKDSPLSANDHPTHAIGQKIFPGKTTPTDSTNRKLVTVRAMIMPARADVPVKFKAFDPDDPHTDMIIDSNMASGGDNHGAPKEGTLSPTSQNTDASGKAEVEFTVSLFAGDNYRVAAACKQAKLDLLTNDNVPVMGMPAVPMFDGALTDLLTVWRKLHQEVDSMPMVTQAQNQVSDTCVNFPASEMGTAVMGLQVQTSNILKDPNPSTNLDTAGCTAADCRGRFQGGTTIFGSTGLMPILDNAGNGNRRITYSPAEDLTSPGLPFAAEDNDNFGNGTMNGSITQIAHGTNFVWTLNVGSHNETPIDWPDFVGGELNVGGGPVMTITGASAAQMTLTTSTMRVPCRVRDDDDLTQLPYARNAVSNVMVNSYLPAYVRPVLAAGAGINNVKAAATINIAPGDLSALQESAWDTHRADDFWVGYILWVDQFHKGQDIDPDNESSAGLGSGRGWCTASRYAGTAIETARDSYLNGAFKASWVGFGYPNFDALIWRTTAHEVGHEFKLNHANGGLMSFAETNANVSQVFQPTDVDKIRKSKKSPGRR